MGIPVGDLSPRGTGMGKKCSPQAFVGIPAGKFFRRGDGFGELKPDGEFPVAIPRHAPATYGEVVGRERADNTGPLDRGIKGKVEGTTHAWGPQSSDSGVLRRQATGPTHQSQRGRGLTR